MSHFQAGGDDALRDATVQGDTVKTVVASSAIVRCARR